MNLSKMRNSEVEPIIMSRDLNLVIFRAVPEDGRIVDFRIVFISSSGKNLFEIDIYNEHAVLLSGLPGRKAFLQSYIELAEKGGSLSIDTLYPSDGSGKLIRSILRAENRNVIETWENLTPDKN